jgi:hypothetical protein
MAQSIGLPLKCGSVWQRSASCAIWCAATVMFQQGANITAATDRGVANRPVSPIRMAA